MWLKENRAKLVHENQQQAIFCGSSTPSFDTGCLTFILFRSLMYLLISVHLTFIRSIDLVSLSLFAEEN